jgi:hypothetical protein
MNFKKLFGKYVYIVAAFTMMGLLSYLSTLPGFSITCTDNVCDINEDCVAYCNVTNRASQTIYLYNYDNWTMDFSPEVKDFDLYWKYYGKWRYTNFTKETRAGNIPDNAKYVFSFPRYKTTEFKIVVKLKDTGKVKYTFGTLDPTLVGYEYSYEELTKEVPVYKDKKFTIESIWYEENQTWSPEYTYTTRELTGYKTEKYKGKITGITIDNKKYDTPNLNLNKEEGYLYVCNIPTGDRNWKEYPLRQYEIDKGVCEKIELFNK